MKKKLLSMLSIMFLTICFTSTPILANDYDVTDSSLNIINDKDIVTRADIIDYQYKVVNNVLYRRLYNYTLNKPVSDWVKVG